jgi:hypothetical protein
MLQASLGKVVHTVKRAGTHLPLSICIYEDCPLRYISVLVVYRVLYGEGPYSVPEPLGRLAGWYMSKGIRIDIGMEYWR